MSISKPNLEQLKKQAKDLVRGHAERAPGALAFLRAHHPHWIGASDDVIAAGTVKLADAHWAIARSLGEASWPALVHELAALPLVPVRGAVVFPGHRIVLDIGRQRSRAAIDAALADDGLVVFIAQRAATIEEPAQSDLHEIGTLGRVFDPQPGRAPGALLVQVEGLRRVRVVRVGERDDMRVIETSPVEVEDAQIGVARAVMQPHLGRLPAEVQQAVLESDDPAHWIDALAAAVRVGT